MRLFQRTLAPLTPDNSPPSVTANPDPAAFPLDSATELWRHRAWLWAAYGLAVVLLLVWGYVILPTDGGWLSLLWWPVALAGVGTGGWWHWRQLRQARSVVLDATPPVVGRRWWRRVPLGLPLILLAGFGLSAFLVTYNPQPLRHDSYEYSHIAYQYLNGGYTPDPVRTPGYTLMLAGIFKLSGVNDPGHDELFGPPDKPVVQAQVAWRYQSVLLLVTALIVYGLTLELRRTVALRVRGLYLGDGLALTAAALVAGCPFLIAYTGVTMTEIPSAFWLTLTVYVWVKALKYPRLIIYPLLAGVSLAWLLQTRPTFIYLPLVVGLTLVWLGRGRVRWLSPVLMGAALALFLWPQTVANWRTWDEPAPVIAADLSTYQTVIGVYQVSYGGLPRYQVVTAEASPDPTYEPFWSRLQDYLPLQLGVKDGQKLSPADRKTSAGQESAYWKGFFADYVSSHPAQYAGTLARRLWLMWNQNFLFPYYDPNYFYYRGLTDNLNLLYLMAGIVGLIAAARRWGRLAWPLWLSLAYLTAINVLVRIEFRYTLPAYPLLLIFVALGLWEVGAALLHLRRPGRPRWLTLGSAAGAILLVGTLTLTSPLIPPTNPTREKALDLTARAQNLAEIHQFEAAQRFFNEAIALYPSEALVWSGRADYYAGQNQSEPALADYNKAIALAPQTPDPYRLRGDLLFRLKRYPQAKADYQKFLQLAPVNHPSRPKVLKQLDGL